MLPQFLANTLLAAAIIILLGQGFALIYRISSFFHIAHGAVFTTAAYTLYALVELLSFNLIFATLIAVALASLLGAAIEGLIHRPLRKRNATPVVHLIASLGLYVATTNALALFFGDQTLRIYRHDVSEGISILGAHLTPVQLMTISAAVLVTAILAAVEYRTDAGLRYRAIESDTILARATGVRVDAVLSGSFFVGSAIAGLAGVLVALDIDVRPTMGFGPLLLAVVAVIVGGLSSTKGLVLAAVLITTIQNIIGWHLGQHWGEPAAFILLLVFLAFRPRGIFGSIPTMTRDQ